MVHGFSVVKLPANTQMIQSSSNFICWKGATHYNHSLFLGFLYCSFFGLTPVDNNDTRQIVQESDRYNVLM
jgi:hypothetical protein